MLELRPTCEKCMKRGRCVGEGPRLRGSTTHACDPRGGRHSEATASHWPRKEAALPPASLEARICSFECTFCANCVDTVLGNVCPNCGGGFVPRPVRPAQDRKGGNFLGKYPASTSVRHRPVVASVHEAFAAALRRVPPEKR